LRFEWESIDRESIGACRQAAPQRQSQCHDKLPGGAMKQTMKSPSVGVAMAIGLWVATSGQCQVLSDAANFPSRPVRIIVPFPAGGPSDIITRIIGQRMGEDWGQPVVIEDRAGANTIIGASGRRQGAGGRIHAFHGNRFDAGDEPVPL
jgi:hypothetical protein